MYFACFYKPGRVWDPDKPVSQQPLQPHITYMLQQHALGRVAIAGPLAGDAGGLNVFKVASREEAQAIVQHDPAIMEGVCVVTDIYEWNPLLIQGLPDTNFVPG